MFTEAILRPDAAQDVLLFCRRCGHLQPLPSWRYPAGDDDIDDVDLFRSEHAGHGLEQALRLPDPAIHDRPPWDPMARTWFRAALGEMSFYVHSWRDSIDQPRRYSLCYAPPHMRTHVEVDATMLRASLEHFFAARPISGEKLDRFVQLTQSLYSALDATSLQIAFDDPDFPNAEIGPCPPAARDDLHARCGKLFAGADELQQIERFIDLNQSEYGALAVRVRRQIESAPD